MFKVPENFRIKRGALASTSMLGNNGAFLIRSLKIKAILFCIASDQMGWEHVSVTVQMAKRCPAWEEMQVIKNLFWDKEDLVIQFHPPEESNINNHQYCLHLWRKAGTNDFVETPPEFMV